MDDGEVGLDFDMETFFAKAPDDLPRSKSEDRDELSAVSNT